MTTPAEITAFALTLVGTPFHAQGRLPGIGLDCIGVAASIAKHFGIQHEDKSAYSLRPTGELMPALDAQFERVTGDPQDGDLLLMAFDDELRKTTSEPHHVAILISENRIVHAYASVKKCVKQPYTDYWRAKVRAIYRFPGVE